MSCYIPHFRVLCLICFDIAKLQQDKNYCIKNCNTYFISCYKVVTEILLYVTMRQWQCASGAK